jgi:signal transduction histidine kinase
MNIIINAHHSIGRGGKISISTLSDDDETVKLKITDTGKGIPRKYHEKVFEPFYTTKSSGGTGLGLSISRDIITSHNGTIKLDSAEGEGATFTITLPINK